MRTVLGLCLLAMVAAGDAGGLKEASDKRNAATEDWNAGRHEDAARKLREAAEIYERLEGDHTADWAITMRALAWNESRLGDASAALGTFARLVEGLATHEALAGEIGSAYTAMYELAKAQDSFEKAQAILRRCREITAPKHLDVLAAQTLHDVAGLAAQHGDVPGGVKLYREAIAERRRLGDDLGVCWSLNNLAYWELQAKDPAAAAGPILQACCLLHEKALVPPQAAVAINLRQVLEHLDADPGPHAAALLAAAAALAGSRMPREITVSRLARPLLEHGDWETVETLAGLKQKGVPAEVAADVTIRAARGAVALGKSADALRWLEGLPTGSGPAAAHVVARVRTARALAHAAAKNGDAFLGAARLAADAWRELDDFEGNRAALAELAAAARALDIDAPDLAKAADEAQRAGAPGGAGGSARAGGDRRGFSKLGLHDPLFLFSFADGRIRVKDEVSGQSLEVPVEWKPRNIALNGVVLTFFGGYVVVRSVDYGGAAATAGAPGSTTLDELGDYWPVPEQGELVLTRNGSVTYR
ncbi:MAG TPA: tetratricopeptide repeat protein [Planctomycetota bacterium]|nr:tetratricopeptide repeat protein [Planctomycetota bacterium]